MVTQAFNSTTSGRLTLNVLLSFAQFEREVRQKDVIGEWRSNRTTGIDGWEWA